MNTREFELLECIIGMSVQSGVIENNNEIDDQGLSAYEEAARVLELYDLTIEVRWQDCSIISNRNKDGRTPGTYFNAEQFNLLQQSMRDLK